MHMRYWVVLAALLSVLAAAQEEPYPFSVLFLSFRDISSDELITDIPVSLQFSNLDIGTRTRMTRILDKDGLSRYELKAGNWELEAILDEQQTSEPDYYAKALFLIEPETFVSNLTVYVTPVGSLEGMVIDKANNRISGAALEFKCKSDQHSTYPTETDQFGAFAVVVVPVGKCKVSAAYQGKVGTEEVKIVQGELVEAVVNLDRFIASSWSRIWYLAGGIAIALLGGVGWYLWKRRKPKQQPKEQVPEETPAQQPQLAEEQKVEEKKDALNPRARDIMATLKENEVAIIKFLLENAFESTQAKLRNALGIPKTTLARAFLALEEKKVLKIEKIGKMKKVVLTEWFLGKE